MRVIKPWFVEVYALFGGFLSGYYTGNLISKSLNIIEEIVGYSLTMYYCSVSNFISE